MKRVLAAFTAALLALTLVSGAALAGGGNSANARVCQKGGYLDRATIIGTFAGTVGPFASEDACLRYAARGGVLDVPIGIVIPSVYARHQAGLQDALKSAGYSAQILYSQDSATEKKEVETLIRRGVEVLILTPQDSAAAAPAAREARAAGVKVIAYDRLILDPAAVDYYVTFDNAATGAAQAQYLIDKAGGTTGNSLYLYAGNSTDNNSFAFLEGAWEKLQPKLVDGTFAIENSTEAVALQANPTLTREQQGTIIGQVTTKWDFGWAYELAAANLVAAHPANGTAFILAPNDDTAGAISGAFVDGGISSFFVTGQDAIQAWVQTIIDFGTGDKQGMTVFKDPRTLARNAVAGAVAYLRGHTPVKTTTFNNVRIDVRSRLAAPVAVTVDNIQAALIDAGFYQPGDFSGTWPGKP